MRILIITSEFPPVIGGAGMYAHDLAIGLSKNNVEVNIITYQNGSGFDEVKSNLINKYKIGVFSFKPLKFLHFLQFTILIKKTLKKRQYDRIILSDGRTKRVFALLSFTFVNEITKSISVFHGNEVNSFFKTPSKLIKYLHIDEKLLKLFAKQVNLITVSENEKNIWQDFLPELAHKIILVKHGVNEDIFYKRSNNEMLSIKHIMQIPLDKKIILSASRLVREKGQDNLLRAFAGVRSVYNNLQLLIVGEGDYIEDLKSIALSLGINENVTFIGGVDRKNMPDYYAVADLFVLTSRFIESFGLVYIEAAGCGVPSISGNLGGVTDVVLNNETGYIVDSFDYKELEEKIIHLLKDEEKRKDLALNAWNFFNDNFTSKQAANNLIQSLN